jgi:hypothetical protein
MIRVSMSDQNMTNIDELKSQRVQSSTDCRLASGQPAINQSQLAGNCYNKAVHDPQGDSIKTIDNRLHRVLYHL